MSRKTFETPSPFNPANVKPDEIAAVYYREDGVMKRVSFAQFDELYEPQLATYAVGAHAQAMMDLGAEIHRQIEQYTMIDNGDMLHGGPHTNNMTATETREIADYYSALWYREFMDACYGINRPKNKSAAPLDTGRNPAKSKPGEIE